MELLVLLGLVAVGVTLSSLVDLGSDEEEITRTDGTEGDDTLVGGDGRDLLLGAAGSDLLDGGAGNDQLEGGRGDDLLQGGTGDDVLLAASGADTLFGGDGADLLYGGVGDDSLSGDDGDDLLEGGQGADTLSGGDGSDLLWGILDSDRTDGVIDATDVVDADRLEGGAGTDLLFLGSGDVANGGADRDAFLTGVYVDGSAPPVIEDFAPGEDILAIQVPTAATVTVAITSDGGAAVVSANGQVVGRLDGAAGTVTLADIRVVENTAIQSSVA